MNEQTISYSNDIKKFYELLDQLDSNSDGGPQGLDCSDSINHLPNRGVEFYFRKDEFRDGSNYPRVVRIGASKRIRERVRSDHLRPDQLDSIFRDHLTIALANTVSVCSKATMDVYI